MENRRLHGGPGILVVSALTVVSAVLLGRALNACDAGVNNSANSTFLLFLFIPCLWTVLLLSWVAVGVLLGNRLLPHALVLAVALLALCWCAFSLFWSGATYACPSGVPPWWPGFLPTPGF
jgi:hypothetical protein